MWPYVLTPTATSCLCRLRIAQDLCAQCGSSLTHGRKAGCRHTHSSLRRVNSPGGQWGRSSWRYVTWHFCASLKGMSSVFFNKGENCIAAGRLFVEDSIHDQFVQKVVSSRLESEPEGQAAKEAVVQSKEGLGSSRWVPPTRGSLENSLESSAQIDITKGPCGQRVPSPSACPGFGPIL